MNVKHTCFDHNLEQDALTRLRTLIPGAQACGAENDRLNPPCVSGDTVCGSCDLKPAHVLWIHSDNHREPAVFDVTTMTTRPLAIVAFTNGADQGLSHLPTSLGNGTILLFLSRTLAWCDTYPDRFKTAVNLLEIALSDGTLGVGGADPTVTLCSLQVWHENPEAAELFNIRADDLDLLFAAYHLATSDRKAVESFVRRNKGKLPHAAAAKDLSEYLTRHAAERRTSIIPWRLAAQWSVDEHDRRPVSQEDKKRQIQDWFRRHGKDLGALREALLAQALAAVEAIE